jgi:hypothetical protein
MLKGHQCQELFSMFNSAVAQDIALALAAIAVITVPMFVGTIRLPRTNREE